MLRRLSTRRTRRFRRDHRDFDEGDGWSDIEKPFCMCPCDFLPIRKPGQIIPCSDDVCPPGTDLMQRRFDIVQRIRRLCVGVEPP